MTESRAARDDSQKRIATLFEPLVEVDALGVFPGCAGHEV
jgi:hypothetical protein